MNIIISYISLLRLKVLYFLLRALIYGVYSSSCRESKRQATITINKSQISVRTLAYVQYTSIQVLKRVKDVASGEFYANRKIASDVLTAQNSRLTIAHIYRTYNRNKTSI